MNDIFIRELVELPYTVKGVTVKDENGDFNIYINSNLCPYERDAALKHEITHIKKDHLYSHKSAEQCEEEVV